MAASNAHQTEKLAGPKRMTTPASATQRDGNTRSGRRALKTISNIEKRSAAAAHPLEIHDSTQLSEEERKALAQHVIRQTPEYIAAWELEHWKQQEKRQFEREMQHRMNLMEQQLQERMKQHQLQYEQGIQDSKAKLEKMESKLQSKIAEVAERERLLVEVERELRRRRQELEKDHESKVIQMQHQIAMAREQCANKIDVVEQKLEQANAKTEELKQELRECNKIRSEYEPLQKKNELLEREIDSLRSQLESCRSTMEECNKKKQTYKYHYQREKAMTKRLEHEKQEMKHMLELTKDRLKHEQYQSWKASISPTAVTQSVPKRDRRQQSTHKDGSATSPEQRRRNQRAAVKDRPHQHVHEHHYVYTGPGQHGGSQKSEMDKLKAMTPEERQSEMRRLIGERAQLIKTGTYAAFSPLIRQIDNKLNALSLIEHDQHQ